MFLPFLNRRNALGAAGRLLLGGSAGSSDSFDPPRLTTRALEKTRMSRTRTAILTNLEEMYREAYERAKVNDDKAQQAALDFAFRREQLYFEILLDVRDAIERR
jgi:hypothetical protein